MNNTPQKRINPSSHPQRPVPTLPPRRKQNHASIIICIVLAVVLTASASLNIALLISRNKRSPEAPVSSETDTNTVSNTVEDTSDTINTATPPYDTGTVGTVSDPQDAELVFLHEMINSYSSSATDKFAVQAGIYDELLDLLKIENRPVRIQYKEAVEESNDSTDESNTESEEPITVKTPAAVAFAYLDLETGYTFSFNADEIMYSASLVKAPYIYSVLKAVEEFENNKLTLTSDGSALYDEDGNPLFEGKHPNLDENGKIIYGSGEEKFDLSREWVYDSKTMFVEGSGNIQTEEDGFTLTYLELAEYALKYSDNIALEALTREFGYGYYNTVASSLEISGVPYGFMQLSANDCIKFLKEIYAYMETDSPYAAVMKKAMSEAPYNVMIPAAVSPTVCAHKYGWDIDSYHDMGIVYHERPFAVVVMTDLDEGRAQDYGYIQNIVRSILKLHESFTPKSSDETVQ